MLNVNSTIHCTDIGNGTDRRMRLSVTCKQNLLFSVVTQKEKPKRETGGCDQRIGVSKNINSSGVKYFMASNILRERTVLLPVTTAWQLILVCDSRPRSPTLRSYLHNVTIELGNCCAIGIVCKRHGTRPTLKSFDHTASTFMTQQT